MTDLLQPLEEERLREWFLPQRWFGSKASQVAQLNVLEAFTLREESPLLVLALVEVRFHPGTHETYQVPLGFRPAEEGWSERVLCVHNLARSAQAVELDLSEYEGRHPIELFGRSRFPRIGELPYLLTLAPRGFYWFQLVEDDD